MTTGRLRRSGTADTGTLVPWYPEGSCILGLWSLKTLPLRIPALTSRICPLPVPLHKPEAFLIFAKIGSELVTERMFTDMRHRFRVLKLTELSYLRMR